MTQLNPQNNRRFSSRRQALIGLGVLFLVFLHTTVLASASERQPEAGTVDTVTFELLISNDYNDTEESLSSVKAFLAFHLAEIAPLTSTDKELELYMFKRYRFGPSQLPKTFGVIRAEVIYLNANRAPEDPWLIPPLPRRRSSNRNRGNPNHSLPRVATFQMIRRLRSVIELSQRGVTEEEQRAGSAFTLTQVTLPRSDYQAIPKELTETSIFLGLTSQFAPIHIHAQKHAHLTSETQAPLSFSSDGWSPVTTTSKQAGSVVHVPEKDFSTEISNAYAQAEVLTTVFATDPRDTAASADSTHSTTKSVPIAGEPPPSSSAPPPLPVKSEQIARIPRVRSAAKRSTFADLMTHKVFSKNDSNKVTYLLILDDGWPGAEESKESYRFFEQAINSRRERYKLPRISLGQPNDLPQYTNHAAEIDAAIRPLRMTDHGERVHVLYVPIILNDATKSFCFELLKAGWLIRRGETQRLLGKPHGLTLLESSATIFAERELAEWEARLKEARAAGEVCQPSSVVPAMSHSGDCFHTDGFLINTIYLLAHFMAEKEKTLFIVNQSWTVNADTIELSPTGDSLTVSATGDDALDVIGFKVDFAKRCVDDDAYLAVMFVDDNFQPDCGSGTIGTPLQKIAFSARAVAYDGEISNGLCGTSFASPRVAWLVAAKANPGHGEFPPDWRTRIQKMVQDSRYGGTDLWRDIYFDVQRFLQQPLQ